MGAHDLIFKLRSNGYSIISDGSDLEISPAEDLPSDLLWQLKQHKPEIIAALKVEQQQDFRREKVLAMLAIDSSLKRAVYADADSDPDNVIITVAVRHVATCELLVLKANYDPWQLLALIDRTGDEHVH